MEGEGLASTRTQQQAGNNNNPKVVEVYKFTLGPSP